MALIAWWKLDETEGSSAEDSTINGNNGVVTGATITDGKFGKARYFQGGYGTGEKITAPFTFTGNVPFTFSCWLKPSDLVDRIGFLDLGAWAYPAAFNACVDTGGSIIIVLYDGYSLTTASGVISDADFQHVVITKSAGGFSSSTVKVYVNGVDKSLTGSGGSSDANFVGSAVTISDRGEWNFKGIIDEAKFFDNALSSSDVTDLYNSYLPSPEAEITSHTISNREVTLHCTGAVQDAGELTGYLIKDSEDNTLYTCDSDELETLNDGDPVTIVITFAAEGGSFGIHAQAVEGSRTGNSDTLALVISPNSSPVCSFTAQLGSDNKSVTINANASNDPDGSIVSWRFKPYTGASWIAGTLGQAYEYNYASHGTKTITVEVTDNEGGTDTESLIIDATNEAPNAEITVQRVGTYGIKITDSSTDSDGEISDITIDWGDDSPTENLEAGGNITHIYEASAEPYELTYTVTDDDSATTILNREISMAVPTITSVSAFTIPLASGGFTITGTNFGTSATVKVGDVAATVTAPNTATSIVVTALGGLTPVGICDVEVTVGSDKVTLTDGVYVTGADAFSSTELKLGLMSKVYFDGVHVGYCQDNVEVTPSAQTLDFIPNDRQSVVKTFAITQTCTLKLTLAQVSAKNLTMAIGAALDADNKTVRIKGSMQAKGESTYASGVPNYSICFKDASGTSYFVPNAQLLEPSNILLNARDKMSLPLSLRCVEDAVSGDVVVITFP